MGKTLSGELSCTGTGLIYSVVHTDGLISCWKAVSSFRLCMSQRVYFFYISLSKAGRVMSWPSSVSPSVHQSVCCPSVNCSCPLHNSDTFQDIFMKLGTNVKHHQTMCRGKEPKLHLQVLWNYAPLRFYYKNHVHSVT